MLLATQQPKERPENLAERIYQQLKTDISEFRLLPGDRFTETEIALAKNVSRTPVRQALYRLEMEGYVEVSFRAGWQVRPFDFDYLEDLYDVRIALEMAALDRLTEQNLIDNKVIQGLLDVWLVPKELRLQDGKLVAQKDEEFHWQLVAATNNKEMARIHGDICERLRFIRRLDFTKTDRINATYQEHGEILQHLMQGGFLQAKALLQQHILTSKAEVRKITLYKLSNARQRPNY